MKTRVVYVWDDEDPFPMGKRVDEAFNRVIDFCPELTLKTQKPEDRPPEQMAWRRVVDGAFKFSDVKTLVAYADTVRQRVNGRYGGNTGDVARGIFQASENLTSIMSDTIRYVSENAGEYLE